MSSYKGIQFSFEVGKGSYTLDISDGYQVEFFTIKQVCYTIKNVPEDIPYIFYGIDQCTGTSFCFRKIFSDNQRKIHYCIHDDHESVILEIGKGPYKRQL